MKNDVLEVLSGHTGKRGIELLKQAAIAGGLSFKGQALFANFFAPVEFYYETLSNGEIGAFFRLENESVRLRDCDLVILGPPHLFIYKRSLRIVRGNIAAKWMRENPLVEDKLLQADEDDPYPRLYQSTPVQEDVWPILKLTDRLGAFANLWIGERLFEKPGRFSKEEEAWEKDLLETGFIYKPQSGSSYYCPVDQIGKSLSFLLECGWKIIDSRGNLVVKQTGADIEYALDQQAVRVKGSLSFDHFKANLQDVVGSFNRREHFVQLGANTVGLLDAADEALSVVLEGEIVADGIALKRSFIGLIPQLSKEYEKTALHSDSKPSDSFKAVLRPYQQEGFSWLCSLADHGFNGLLADDMGLGKTVQVLSFLSIQEKGPHLIVMPTSLLFHWQREIERFLPGRKIYMHTGAQRLKSLADQEFVLTTYAILRLDSALFASVHFKSIILDEAQVIKNPEAQVSKAAYTLHADFKLSVTGTPVENHLYDLWSQFHFLMPELLGSKEEFDSIVQASQVDRRHLRLLRKKLSPFLLRRSKKEVAKDLPEKIEQVVYVQMSPDQRAYYESFLAGIRTNLLKKVSLEGMKAHRIEVFEAILRLRQICCHPLLLGEKAESGKFEALISDLQTILEEGRKVLVYSQFTSMLQMIYKEMKNYTQKIAYLDGSTNNREEVVRAFQTDPEVQLFLISLKAGGVGLNLTQADYVLLFDPWWNEAAENQAIDRAHRIGREEVVIAKRYITTDCIEEKMMTLKRRKRALVKDLLEEEWESTQMSEDDLRFLLE